MCTPLASLTPLVEVLPATAAGNARAIHWFRGLARHGYGVPFAFVVLDGSAGCEGYGVKEVPGGYGWRAFDVKKCGGDPATTPYRVTCGTDPRLDACDCAAGTFSRGVVVCRHVLAIRAALDNGWIAPEADERPAAWDAGYTDAELERMAGAARPAWVAKAESTPARSSRCGDPGVRAETVAQPHCASSSRPPR